MELHEIKELRVRIGRAIRKLRDEERISAAFVGELLGVAASTISRIESGSLSISAEHLFFLARRFNRPISFFLGEQSSVVHSSEDFLRAALVKYGATQLKAKSSIDVDTRWFSYEDFLASALTYVKEPRIVEAIAATLYFQAEKNQLNDFRILSLLQNKRLIAVLAGIIRLIEDSIGLISDAASKKKIAFAKLSALREGLVNEIGEPDSNSGSALPVDISPSDVSKFINESLKYV
ncbi:MAG TPA: helix-turn-helix transcriptional regulator [bacterium]|nr:helix-turn-helix transcriptional regulator [bacterium]